MFAGRVWGLKGIIRKRDKSTCPFCSGDENMKHVLLDYLETRNWRAKFLKLRTVIYK